MSSSVSKTKLIALREKVGGRIFVSKKGVPHLVIDRMQKDYPYSSSICWFGKSSIFRMFTPYVIKNRVASQTKMDFKSEEEVIDYLKENK